MKMKLNIRSKLIGGFVIVLAVLVLAGGVSILRIRQIDATVENLAGNLATDQMLADEMVSQILLVRFYANKYISEDKPEYLERYDEEVAAFDDIFAQSDEAITKEERVEMLKSIEENFATYTETFREVTDIIAERHGVQTKVLDVQGPLAQKLLEELALSAFQAGDATAAYYSGEAEASLNLMRLNAFKYLQFGDHQWLTKP